MRRLLPGLIFCLLTGGCANARNTGTVPGSGKLDGGAPDAKVTPPPPKKDGGRKDGPASDSKPWPKDLPSLPDQGEPDLPPPKPCPDSLEPNDTCLAGRTVGSTTEGAAWVTRTGTLSPPGDVDWLLAEGKEKPHTCLPFTSQTYYFRMRLTVPAGRQVKGCIAQDSCSAANVCQTVTGPGQILVKYKVSGTCAFSDDTQAKLLVQALDGKHDCAAYTVGFNYDK